MLDGSVTRFVIGVPSRGRARQPNASLVAYFWALKTTFLRVNHCGLHIKQWFAQRV